MESQNLVIGDRHCSLVRSDRGGPTILCCNHDGPGGDQERLRDAIALCELVGGKTEKGFSLLSFEVDSWNNDLSPWRHGSDFSGGGDRILAWILLKALPYLKEQGQRSFFMAGYSLAGLFSLWCARKTDSFEGVASCSGSLWFPGWSEFSDENPIRREDSIIYLSLGGKEALAKNPLIATILDRTREEAERLRKDGNVKRTTLEMNAGGHFTKPLERVAKGITYLLMK